MEEEKLTTNEMSEKFKSLLPESDGAYITDVKTFVSDIDEKLTGWENAVNGNIGNIQFNAEAYDLYITNAKNAHGNHDFFFEQIANFVNGVFTGNDDTSKAEEEAHIGASKNFANSVEAGVNNIKANINNEIPEFKEPADYSDEIKVSSEDLSNALAGFSQSMDKRIRELDGKLKDIKDNYLFKAENAKSGYNGNGCCDLGSTVDFGTLKTIIEDISGYLTTMASNCNEAIRTIRGNYIPNLYSTEDIQANNLEINFKDVLKGENLDSTTVYKAAYDYINDLMELGYSAFEARDKLFSVLHSSSLWNGENGENGENKAGAYYSIALLMDVTANWTDSNGKPYFDGQPFSISYSKPYESGATLLGTGYIDAKSFWENNDDVSNYFEMLRNGESKVDINNFPVNNFNLYIYSTTDYNSGEGNGFAAVSGSNPDFADNYKWIDLPYDWRKGYENAGVDMNSKDIHFDTFVTADGTPMASYYEKNGRVSLLVVTNDGSSKVSALEQIAINDYMKENPDITNEDAREHIETNVFPNYTANDFAKLGQRAGLIGDQLKTDDGQSIGSFLRNGDDSYVKNDSTRIIGVLEVNGKTIEIPKGTGEPISDPLNFNQEEKTEQVVEEVNEGNENIEQQNQCSNDELIYDADTGETYCGYNNVPSNAFVDIFYQKPIKEVIGTAKPEPTIVVTETPEPTIVVTEKPEPIIVVTEKPTQDGGEEETEVQGTPGPDGS